MHESAHVTLNGKDVGTFIGPWWRVDIPAADLRESNVLEVAGGDRKGTGPGQFSEATNMSSDSKGDLIVADTQHDRATLLIPPANGSASKK